METVAQFSMRVEQVDGFEFHVKFDKEKYAELAMDEPPPLGKDHAPNPARILAAAVGNCLSASLLFCLQKQGMKISGLTSDVHVELVRNEHRRLRIGKIEVHLHPKLPPDHPALTACLASFEDFCVVTQSVREGLDVRVAVEPTS